MKTIAPRLAVATALACAAFGAHAGGAADSITVVDPYVRLAPPGAPATGAFMVLKNGGAKDARLVKAENSASKITELHGHINDGGVMRMRPVAAIDIKAHGEAVLKPGGLHVMLIDLKGPMKEGDQVGLTLGFDDGSSKQVQVPVQRPTAPGMAPAAAMPMDHHHSH